MLNKYEIKGIMVNKLRFGGFIVSKLVFKGIMLNRACMFECIIIYKSVLFFLASYSSNLVTWKGISINN